MRILGLDVKFPTFTRNRDGDVFYDVNSYNDWFSMGNNMSMAMNHPILSPALLFVSKLFSQARFKLKDKVTGEIVEKSPYLDLLNNPNPTQTLGDLLEALLFTEIANGVGVLYLKRNVLKSEPNSIYVLDFSKIKFPDKLKSGNFINMSQEESYLNTKVIYDEANENLEIKLKDLMFFYDLPNVGFNNPFKAQSRIAGLHQTLINTQDSLIAKNIILKSNGKELISGIKEGFPLSPEEKKQIEDNYSNNYGMTFSRKRGIVVGATVTHKSLHIALRDLGLDESVKTDGNIIYTALHIPKDILSLEAKKTTYNNFKESMSSYIQNEMQSTLDGFCATLNKRLIDGRYEIVGNYDHLPIMQYILIERYNSVLKRADALLRLRQAGLPDKEALKLVGLDENIKLSELKVRGTQSTSSTQSNSTENGQASEEKVREIIEEYL